MIYDKVNLIQKKIAWSERLRISIFWFASEAVKMFKTTFL